MSVRALLCRVRGHVWVDCELRYRPGQTTAYIGGVEPVVVPVTWCCDEVCARCGGETWWPA